VITGVIGSGRGSMVWLLLFPLTTGYISCTEKSLGDALPNRQWTPAEFDADALNFVFGTETEKDVCALTEYQEDEGKILEDCIKFCGENAMPFVLGSLQSGFGLSDMVDICIAPDGLFPSGVNRELLRSCGEASHSVRDLQLHATSLVAVMKEFQFEKVLFKSQMVKANAMLRAAMKNPDLQHALARAPDKKALLQNSFRAILAKEEFSTPVTNIKKAVSKLSQTITEFHNGTQEGVKNLKYLLEHCTGVFTGIGPHDEFLLDECAQRSVDCIEQTHGQHIGCCCGFVPLSKIHTGFSDVTIAGSNAWQAGYSQNTHNGLVSICSRAEDKAKDRIEQIHDTLHGAGDGKYFVDLASTLTAKYPDYAKQTCAVTGRRLEAEELGSGTHTADLPRALSTTIVDAQGDAADWPPHWPAPSCNEPQLKDADPLPAGWPSALYGLGVAFGPNAMDDVCKYTGYRTGIGDGNQRSSDEMLSAMSHDCDRFCGPDAIPFFLGSPAYGFDLASAAEVCAVGAPPADSECETWAKSFSVLHESFISVIMSLEEFTLAVLRNAAEVISLQEKVNRYFQSEEWARELMRVGDKKGHYLNAAKDMLRETLGDPPGAPRYLKGKIELLLKYTDAFEVVARERVDDLTKFVTQCVEPSLGVSKENHFLLDICPQKDVRCIEESGAQHASCCCGVNRALWLGTSATGSDKNIPGLDGLREQVDSVDAGLSATVDICGEAFERGRDVFSAQRSEILQTSAGQQLLHEYDSKRTSEPCADMLDSAYV